MHAAIGQIKATRRRLASVPREDGHILRIIRGRISLRVRSEHGHFYGDRLSKSPAEASIAAAGPLRAPAALRAAALSLLGYLQSGPQPIPANFVAALAAVETNATSATTKSKNLTFIEILWPHQGSPMWRSAAVRVRVAVTLKVKHDRRSSSPFGP